MILYISRYPNPRHAGNCFNGSDMEIVCQTSESTCKTWGGTSLSRPVVASRPSAKPPNQHERQWVGHHYSDQSWYHMASLHAIAKQKKAGSTWGCSQAVPHPSTNQALRRLTSEVERDPVHSTWYGRQRIQMFCNSQTVLPEMLAVAPSTC